VLPDTIGFYAVVLFWQAGFDKYLQDEYTLTTPLWIFGNILTLDHVKKRIIVFVRDFSIESLEDKYTKKVEIINRNNRQESNNVQDGFR